MPSFGNVWLHLYLIDLSIRGLIIYMVINGSYSAGVFYFYGCSVIKIQ